MNPWESEEARQWEEWRIQQTAAHRAHDHYHVTSFEMLKSVIAFGVEAIRTAAFINGGATVASIALIGSVYAKDPTLARALSNIIIFFAAGTLFAGLSSGFACFAQFFYALRSRASTLDFEHPYVHDTKSAKGWGWIGGICHLGCAVLVAVSYGCLVTGVLSLTTAI